MKNKARSAVIWNSFDSFIRQGVGFVISVILARLLVPEDFGTLALLTLFLAMANVFVNAGFSMALIQKQDVTHIDESTVFWFNMGAALVMTLAFCAISPWIADFFALPILVPLVMLMACNILISAMSSIHSTLLTKSLNFKMLMKIGVISTILSGCVGIYMAMLGYGVWALAGQSLTGSVVSTMLFWFLSPWRPLLAFSQDSFKKLFSFGGWIFASWTLHTLYLHVYNLLIGKYYGVYDLGIYKRADNTQKIPSNVLSEALNRVTLPLFSSVNHDKERLQRGVRMSVRSMMLVAIPSMIGLAVLAEPFVYVVFGEQWLPAVPILQVLCATGLLLPLQVINSSVLQAQGYGNLFFRLSIIKNTLGLVLLVLGSFFGVMGIAWSRVIHSIIALIVNTHYTNKHLEYGFRAQILDCVPSSILGILMAIVILYADNVLVIGGAIELILLIVIGATFYLASNILLGINVFKETLAFIKGR